MSNPSLDKPPLENPPDGYLSYKKAKAYAAINRGRLVVGCQVRARFPNARLGTGTITAIRKNRREKPLVVQMDVGECAFHYDQVDLISLPNDQPVQDDPAIVQQITPRATRLPASGSKRPRRSR